jgi:hypothetical protein
VNTLDQLFDQTMAPTSYTLIILAIAGGMAPLLSIVGIYGVIAYAISHVSCRRCCSNSLRLTH